MPRIPKIKIPEASVSPETAVSRNPSKGKSVTLIVILGGLLIIAISVAGYFYWQYKHSPEVVNAEELKKMKSEIGSLLLLPTDEDPTLATVTDKSKLQSQAFFKNSENGDKVLIYPNSGKAVLYRPSLHKIVDVTTVNVNPDQSAATNQAPAAAPAPTAPSTPSTPAPSSPATPTEVSLALYNGTTKVGVTNALGDEIQAKFSAVTVAKKEKAVKTDYTETEVIDLSGKNAELATQIAAAIGGSVAPSLPDGEASPGTDILVIAGQKP